MKGFAKEDGTTGLSGKIHFGDYVNGRFEERASYTVEWVEHDKDGVSLVLRVPRGDRIFRKPIRLNIPRNTLLELEFDHSMAMEDSNFVHRRRRRTVKA